MWNGRKQIYRTRASTTLRYANKLAIRPIENPALTKLSCRRAYMLEVAQIISHEHK